MMPVLTSSPRMCGGQVRRNNTDTQTITKEGWHSSDGGRVPPSFVMVGNESGLLFFFLSLYIGKYDHFMPAFAAFYQLVTNQWKG